MKEFGPTSATGVHATFAMKNMQQLSDTYSFDEEAAGLWAEHGPGSDAWHEDFDETMVMTITAVFGKSPEKVGQ